MIENYDNDEKMALYGRYCAVNRAIRKAKESIRDKAVMIGNSEDVDEIKQARKEFIKAVDDLIEALCI